MSLRRQSHKARCDHPMGEAWWYEETRCAAVYVRCAGYTLRIELDKRALRNYLKRDAAWKGEKK